MTGLALINVVAGGANHHHSTSQESFGRFRLIGPTEVGMPYGVKNVLIGNDAPQGVGRRSVPKSIYALLRNPELAGVVFQSLLWSHGNFAFGTDVYSGSITRRTSLERLLIDINLDMQSWRYPIIFERDWGHQYGTGKYGDVWGVWRSRGTNLYPNNGDPSSLALFEVLVGIPPLKAGDPRIYDYEPKADTLNDKAVFISGLLLFVGGISLLYFFYRNLYYNLTPNVNVAGHVTLIFSCAIIIWVGMGIAAAGIGLFTHS